MDRLVPKNSERRNAVYPVSGILGGSIYDETGEYTDYSAANIIAKRTFQNANHTDQPHLSVHSQAATTKAIMNTCEHLSASSIYFWFSLIDINYLTHVKSFVGEMYEGARKEW